jgi:hypothetical protein
VLAESRGLAVPAVGAGVKECVVVGQLQYGLVGHGHGDSGHGLPVRLACGSESCCGVPLRVGAALDGSLGALVAGQAGSAVGALHCAGVGGLGLDSVAGLRVLDGLGMVGVSSSDSATLAGSGVV